MVFWLGRLVGDDEVGDQVGGSGLPKINPSRIHGAVRGVVRDHILGATVRQERPRRGRVGPRGAFLPASGYRGQPATPCVTWANGAKRQGQPLENRLEIARISADTTKYR